MASPLDRAFVEILPDFSKFVRAFKKDIDNATSTLENRFDASFARIERMAGVSARSIVDKFTDAFDRLGRQAANAAEDVQDELDDINAPDVDVDVNVDKRQVEREVDRAVRSGRPPKIPIDIDLDREGTFSKFVSSLTGIRLPIAGFIALGSAVGAAAAAAIQLTAAMAPAVGIIAGLPSAIGVGAALMTTLQVATMGVGEAFSAAATGDAAQFEAALEGLAPTVQAAAQTIRDLKPAFDELRNSVQSEFFAGFDAILQRLADTLMGPVTEGMTTAASSVNALITGLSMVATSQEGIDFVTQSFAILNTIITNLTEPITLLFSSLLNIGTAINEAFGATAGEGLANLITQFALFLDQAAASGEAVAWVNNAVTVFEQLGAIISPIVGIIGSIGDAARISGGNILGAFGEALQVFDDFLNTADGMATLVSVFEAFNQIGSVFGDILQGIGPALPPLISGISSLVGAVAPLISALAPLVGAILTALAPLLTAVANAITPLIPPIIQLAEMIGGVLVTAINAVMPIVTTLLTLFSSVAAPILEIIMAQFQAFSPILMTLLEVLSPILTALQPLFDIFVMIAELIGSILVPVFEVLGGILLWVVETIIVPVVVPIIEFLADLLTTLLGGAVEKLAGMFETAGPVIQVVWELLKAGIQSSVDAIMAVWDALSNAFKAGWDFIMRTTITPMKNGFTALKNTATGIITSMRSAWDNFVSFLKGIPGKVSGALGSIFSPLWTGFKSAINSVIDGWNGLSFSVPSVDLGPLGSTPAITVSTPNIPRLKVGGMSMGEGLANLDPNEAILPLEDRRTENLLAGAIQRAMEGMAGATTATATAGPGGDIYVDVRIGETPLNDIVDTRITASNQQMLRRARAGTRRNS